MQPRLTKQERIRFDVDVLATIDEIAGGLTWRIQDQMDRPGKPWHGRFVQTADVLRACRRLEKLHLVRLQGHRTSYRAMLFWEVTDGGRGALNLRASKGGGDE